MKSSDESTYKKTVSIITKKEFVVSGDSKKYIAVRYESDDSDKYQTSADKIMDILTTRPKNKKRPYLISADDSLVVGGNENAVGKVVSSFGHKNTAENILSQYDVASRKSPPGFVE